MNYSYQKPDVTLTDYVQTILVVADSPDFEASNLPLFTNGVPALFCQIDEIKKPRLILFGQGIPPEELTNKQNFIAVFFKPFAMGSIFKVSAKELKEKSVALDLWNPKKTRALLQELSGASSSITKVEILNLFVLNEFRANQNECEIIQFSTSLMMENHNQDVLGIILGALNLTERTFQRIFKKYVGITASQYRRICQFYFAFSQLKGKHFDKLSDLAYSNGYSDQSHYIRSFKEFTAITPNGYLQNGLAKKEE